MRFMGSKIARYMAEALSDRELLTRSLSLNMASNYSTLLYSYVEYTYTSYFCKYKYNA